MANFPNLWEEKNVVRFLNKQVSDFKYHKLFLADSDEKKSKSGIKHFNGTVLVQTSDLNTIKSLLMLHGHKLQGNILKSWLMGFEYLGDEGESMDWQSVVGYLSQS